MVRRSEAELEEERALIEAAQRDQRAFAALYERYVDQIFAYLYNLTKDREEAEDMTAATFAKALETLPSFRWQGVPYSAWLYRVAGNMLSRQRRRPGWLELSSEIRGTTADPAEAAELADRNHRLRQAVTELPQDQRQAVLLRFGGGMRNKEIAAIMGRSEGAVKLLTFRALTNLRRRLDLRVLAPGNREDKDA